MATGAYVEGNRAYGRHGSAATKKTVHIGLYSDTPEEAASIYARAAFCLERMKSDLFSDSV